MAININIVRAFVKDPDSTLIYTFDWANGGPNDGSLDDDGWLQGAEISSSSFVLPADLNNVIETNTTTTASIKLSGGKNGKDYVVTNRVVTDGGETDDRSIQVNVRQR